MNYSNSQHHPPISVNTTTITNNHCSASTDECPLSPLGCATEDAYKNILLRSVASIVKNSGFETAHSGALEMLIHMLMNFFNETCQSARSACEHAGRTIVNPSDAYLGLLNSGVDMDDFAEYLRKYSIRHQTIPDEPVPQPSPKSSVNLHIGNSLPHSSNIPSYLPPFPDPHTYRSTQVSEEIETNYLKVRHLQGVNRRATENSLVNYALLTHPTISIFQEYERSLDPDDTSAHTVPKVLLPFDDDKPYVSALITDDIDLEDDQNYLAHIFNEDEFEDSDDDEAVDKD